MILQELMELLGKIIKAHPEAAESEVWAIDSNKNGKVHVGYVGFDKRHKPPRIKLEE